MIGLFKNYIEKRISLLKLETTETSVKVLSMAVYILLLVTLGICFFAFFCLGLGLVIGNLLGNYAYGMLIMASIFLVGLLVVFSQKKSIIEKVKEHIGEKVALILLSANSAMDYYPKINFEKADNAFIIKRKL